MSTAITQLCPCGSERVYSACCGPYLQGQAIPATPEELMRSRYTAYSQANMDYIQRTMTGSPLRGFNPEETRIWAAQAQWLSLKVISAPLPSAGSQVGYVEFIAVFIQRENRQVIYERSEFQRNGERWFYIGGRTPKINRNDECPCGSGKKSKRCCLSSFSQ